MAAREGASTALTPDVLEAKLTEGLKATFVQVSQRRAHHITRSHALMLLLQTDDVQLTQNRHPCQLIVAMQRQAYRQPLAR